MPFDVHRRTGSLNVESFHSIGAMADTIRRLLAQPPYARLPVHKPRPMQGDNDAWRTEFVMLTFLPSWASVLVVGVRHEGPAETTNEILCGVS